MHLLFKYIFRGRAYFVSMENVRKRACWITSKNMKNIPCKYNWSTYAYKVWQYSIKFYRDIQWSYGSLAMSYWVRCVLYVLITYVFKATKFGVDQ